MIEGLLKNLNFNHEVRRKRVLGDKQCANSTQIRTTGFYVQDVRYAAGAWMHRSGHLQTGSSGSQTARKLDTLPWRVYS